jgi:hypothetical protein
MPIKITKGGAQRSAPVVEGALKATPAPEPVKDDAVQRWKKQPAIGAKVKECAYCHQHYIQPCTEAQHGKCMNFLHLKGEVKAV